MTVNFCVVEKMLAMKSQIGGQKSPRLADARIHETRYSYEKEWHDAVIYDRNKLGVGTVVGGPAIVVEMDSTTLILPGHAATVDKISNLLINPA